MHLNRNIFSAAVFFIHCLTALHGYGQLGFSFDIKKPQQYDDRVLGSEKSDQKKFTLPRRFIQNTFTHYNYFFNANNKLNEIIEQAKAEHQDDFTKLLSFYNYSLDVTAQNRSQLDSVIYKSTTGIVLHDLRNDWVDNLYLLTGAAYYLRKQFDSAYLTFQFINYAFADKEKDGYYKNIGSRLDGNNALSISTQEKNSLPKKIFSEPPSRNEAFIWLIRTLIAQEEYAESASLLITLKSDPVFPKRLRNDLEEVQAWWFYNNNVYDSAAYHLSKALDNATTKTERARWEYLTAQLYERSKDIKMAKSFYEKVISHTTDPIMEIYARLSSIRINKEGEDNYIDRNIAELLKMGKRDKYVEYRDVIYFTVAQMEIERGNSEEALQYLGKSTEFNTSNIALKNSAWLQMADIAFARKKYKQANNYYDSLNFSDPALKDPDKIRTKMEVLGKITKQIEIIERQDSLQRIASLNEPDRKEYVRKLVRQIRKLQGLKEEPTTLITPIGNTPVTQTDLFTSSSKGEWYFYNASLRTKGLSEFKAKWGNRPNVDNWRRNAGMNFTQPNRSLTTTNVTGKAVPTQPGEISFDALYDLLPLTEEMLKISNDSISNALFILGKSLAEDVEDCSSSIKIFEELITRFPKHEKIDEVYFNLYYCYTKSEVPGKALTMKKMLQENFPLNPLTTIVTTGKDPRNKNSNTEATKTYEHIYDLFLEGNFAQAVTEKAEADKKYGSTYWTPRLLYIESVYYIKQKQDDKALESLSKIVQMNAGTPIAEKASRLVDVLSRRQQIEDELRNLNIERPKEEIVTKSDTLTAIKKIEVPKIVAPKQQVIQPAANNQKIIKPTSDSVLAKPAPSLYTFKDADKYYVMVFLNKLDLVWANEVKNAFNMYNRGKIYNKQFELSIVEINSEYKALLIGNFDNAQAASDYLKTIKPISSSQIVPWLKEEKFSFSLISPDNLEILKSQKDINAYKVFIDKNLPGIF